MFSTQKTTSATLKNDYKYMSFDDLLGVPYKDHGRDKNGYDCYGLAIEAARRFGYKLDDVIYDDHALELSDEYKPTLNVTPIDKPRAGALIEMKCGDELHVGICINSREFIHMTRTGCRINQIGAINIRGLYGINTRI